MGTESTVSEYRRCSERENVDLRTQKITLSQTMQIFECLAGEFAFYFLGSQDQKRGKTFKMNLTFYIKALP